MYARENQQGNRGEVTVIGTGIVSVAPNLATIRLGVTTIDENVVLAEAENLEKMTNLINDLTNLGIEKKDIQTTSFNVFPRYDYSNGKKFVGYEVSNIIEVTIRNFSLLSNVIYVAVNNGVTDIGSLQFKYDDLSSIEQQALELAVIDANQKTLSIIGSLPYQKELIPIKIVEQSESGVRPEAFMLASKSVATPIEPGEIVISSTLQVTYIFS